MFQECIRSREWKMQNRHVNWRGRKGQPLRQELCTSLRIAITLTHTQTLTHTPTHMKPGNLPREYMEMLSLLILLLLQSTVSESTLIALLAARKNKILEMKASEPGADESCLNARLIAYASDQVSCSAQVEPPGSAWLLESSSLSDFLVDLSLLDSGQLRPWRLSKNHRGL